MPTLRCCCQAPEEPERGGGRGSGSQQPCWRGASSPARRSAAATGGWERAPCRSGRSGSPMQDSAAVGGFRTARGGACADPRGEPSTTRGSGRELLLPPRRGQLGCSAATPRPGGASPRHRGAAGLPPLLHALPARCASASAVSQGNGCVCGGRYLQCTRRMHRCACRRRVLPACACTSARACMCRMHECARACRVRTCMQGACPGGLANVRVHARSVGVPGWACLRVQGRARASACGTGMCAHACRGCKACLRSCAPSGASRVPVAEATYPEWGCGRGAAGGGGLHPC